MRSNIASKPAQDLRHGYVQRYLKLFFRRVHPDLFQNHPKEQLRNSTSLQDLLPLVQHDRNKTSYTQSPTPLDGAQQGKPASLAFYFKQKDTPPSASASPKKPNDPSTTTTRRTSDLTLVEHTLPVLDFRIPSLESIGDTKRIVLEQEIKSWQMVQSFLELCHKVGVAVSERDQQDVAQHLDQSIKDATAASRKQAYQQQKPLSEIFRQELQSSFSGSVGGAKTATINGDMDVDLTHLGKIGGSAPALDAELLIQSNPLLFKSPELSSARLSKVVRTWIHWQEEDQQQQSSMDSSDLGYRQETAFQLGHWWRKVPVMVLSSASERTQLLRSGAAAITKTSSEDGNGKANTGQSVKGVLVVDQDMSKQEMSEYLVSNLERVQLEYQEMLRASSPSSHSQQQGRAASSPPSPSTSSLSPEAASYLDRMRTKAMLQNARSGRRRSSRGPGRSPAYDKQW
ncbi:hypothetical protein BGZ98_008729 [Dissophora globulifera]|nr:hypothetical protein BGZ98_008729 [Dissophora globulifera]